MSLYRGRPEVSAQGQREPFDPEGTCHDLPPTSASDPRSQEDESPVGIRPAPEEGDKRA